MTAYYNEWEPYAAQWLRNLIADGQIAPGDVDERDIRTIDPAELKGYTQCHFFAGIGGWQIALRLAGWPDDRPVWTGSCPCQCFSSAGKGAAQSDERHLWPDWYRLIRECRPPIVFGEQVDEAIAYGWLDDALADMEKASYACAAVVLPACSVSSPHERHRIFFVADSQGKRERGETRNIPEAHGGQNGKLLEQFNGTIENAAIPESGAHTKPWLRQDAADFAVADTNKIRCQGSISEAFQGKPGEPRELEGGTENFNNGWPISASKLCGMDDGIFRRASKLSAYGNAIVPQVAAEFIKATM